VKERQMSAPRKAQASSSLPGQQSGLTCTKNATSGTSQELDVIVDAAPLPTLASTRLKTLHVVIGPICTTRQRLFSIVLRYPWALGDNAEPGCISSSSITVRITSNIASSRGIQTKTCGRGERNTFPIWMQAERSEIVDCAVTMACHSGSKAEPLRELNLSRGQFTLDHVPVSRYYLLVRQPTVSLLSLRAFYNVITFSRLNPET
jgi:hypothetical protein